MVLKDEVLLTLTEVRKHCNVSVSTIRRWLREGRLKTVRLPGGHHRVHPLELTKLLGGTTFVVIGTEDDDA